MFHESTASPRPAIFHGLARVPVMFHGRYEILAEQIAAALRSRRIATGVFDLS
jgi:hypothetical protein